MYRLTEKYFPTEAQDHLTDADAAFQRELDLNPDVPMAHKLYAYLEVEEGRAVDVMLRLIEQAKKRTADPELFAGLVHACRYCGLLEASAAAHDHTRRLDPKMPTSVVNTYWHLGDYARVADYAFERNPTLVAMTWLMLSRSAGARLGANAVGIPLQLRSFLGRLASDVTANVADRRSSGRSNAAANSGSGGVVRGAADSSPRRRQR